MEIIGKLKCAHNAYAHGLMLVHVLISVGSSNLMCRSKTNELSFYSQSCHRYPLEGFLSRFPGFSFQIFGWIVSLI